MSLSSLDVLIAIKNDCSLVKVTPIFQPILADAISAYKEIFRDLILNIRLLGSVPRGDVICGKSDIDFIAILNRDPIEDELSKLKDFEISLLKQYPIVSKVDLGYVYAEKVGEFQKFVFTTDSISIDGNDLYPAEVIEISAAILAKLVTPDTGALLSDYKNKVRALDENNPLLLFQWSRWCGKDLIKCYRGGAILKEAIYERTIDGAYQQILRCFPEHSELFRILYNLYQNPVKTKYEILDILNLAPSSI
jgi:hypothetical protein